VTFRWKDYRVQAGAKGKKRYLAMPQQLMHRFLLDMLPGGLPNLRSMPLLTALRSCR
jgi:hypothetical protein